MHETELCVFFSAVLNEFWVVGLIYTRYNFHLELTRVRFVADVLDHCR